MRVECADSCAGLYRFRDEATAMTWQWWAWLVACGASLGLAVSVKYVGLGVVVVVGRDCGVCGERIIHHNCCNISDDGLALFSSRVHVVCVKTRACYNISDILLVGLSCRWGTYYIS